MIEIGKRIKTLRTKRNLTMRQLAELTGLTQGYISQVERGISGYTQETIAKIADVFHVSPILLQSPDVDLDKLVDISEILSNLSDLPPEKIEAVRSMIDALKP